MNKLFVPYAESLELKELGFDEPCFGLFTRSNNELLIKEIPNQQECEQYFGGILAPTFSQAFKWFREKSFRFCVIDDHSNNEKPYTFTTEHEYYYDVGSGNDWYKTFDEAELECLRKLIEIAKNGKTN